MSKDFFKISFHNSQDMSKLRNFMSIPEKKHESQFKENSPSILTYSS